MRLVILISALFISSCATNKSNEKFSYIEKPKADCIKIGTFNTVGFSFIPPVASAVARSMLEQKAQEYKANTLQINKESGLFQVDIEATGYRCSASS